VALVRRELQALELAQVVGLVLPVVSVQELAVGLALAQAQVRGLA
jgi:hypothetical protein